MFLMSSIRFFFSNLSNFARADIYQHIYHVFEPTTRVIVICILENPCPANVNHIIYHKRRKTDKTCDCFMGYSGIVLRTNAISGGIPFQEG